MFVHFDSDIYIFTKYSTGYKIYYIAARLPALCILQFQVSCILQSCSPPVDDNCLLYYISHIN